MLNLLDVDLQDVLKELRSAPFLPSRDIFRNASDIFQAKRHGYSRVDDHTLVHILNFQAAQDYALELVRSNMLCFQVLISGTYMRESHDRVESVDTATAQITNMTRSLAHTQAGSRLRGVLIVIDRDYFLEHYGLELERIPAIHRPTFTSRIGVPQPLKIPIFSTALVITDHMISSPFQGPLREVLLAAKATELLCEIVAHLYTHFALAIGHSPASGALQGTSARHQAVQAAAEIYRREMAKPPTIEQLAHRVGLNRNLLTEGFNDVFGNSPHSYLVGLRMQEGQRLLSQGFSISDIGRRVGYSGYTSFVRAYAEHFGHAPSKATDIDEDAD